MHTVPAVSYTHLGNTIIPLTANQAILPPSDTLLRLAPVEKKQIAKAYYDLDAEVMVRISSRCV